MNIATSGLLRAVGLALAGTLALAAPAVSSADGIGYSISVGGPGFGVSYAGCGDCRGWGGGWVSSGWGDDDGWYPAGRVYAAPVYYGGYGDGYYRRPVVVYRGYEEDGWRGLGDWHRERGWQDRGWRGGDRRGGDRGWHGRGGRDGGGWHGHHDHGGD